MPVATDSLEAALKGYGYNKAYTEKTIEEIKALQRELASYQSNAETFRNDIFELCNLEPGDSAIFESGSEKYFVKMDGAHVTIERIGRKSSPA